MQICVDWSISAGLLPTPVSPLASPKSFGRSGNKILHRAPCETQPAHKNQYCCCPAPPTASDPPPSPVLGLARFRFQPAFVKMQHILLSLSLLVSAAIGGALASEDLKIDVTLPVECERRTQKGDKIDVHYRGTLQSNGEKFDAS